MLVLGAWCVFQMTSRRQFGCRSQIQPCQLRAVGEKHIYLLYLPWVLTLLNTAAEKGTSHKCFYPLLYPVAFSSSQNQV